MSSLTRKPKTQEEFIAEANKPKESAQPVEKHKISEVFPWEDPRVRADVIRGVNLRIPEPYLLKLRYIAENTPHSMQKFLLKVVLPAIDEKIVELTKER